MTKETPDTHDLSLIKDKPGDPPSVEATRKAMAQGIKKYFLPFSEKLKKSEAIVLKLLD